MKSGCEDRRTIGQGLIQPLAAPGLPKTQSGIRKSTASRWRAAALIGLNLFMVAHVIQWRSWAEPFRRLSRRRRCTPSSAARSTPDSSFSALAILATLIFGRFVCGWGCHILALQDFCGWLLKKMGLTPKPFRSRLLVYVPLIAALYMFVWPTAYRFFLAADAGPLIPKLTNHLVTENFWETFPSVAVAIPFLFICGFVIVYFFGQKGFCTYACPYGGFFGLADKLAPRKDPSHRCLQPMRPLHRHVHFERSRSRGSEGLQDGRRSRLHEMHGLHQRLPERRLVFRFWKTRDRRPQQPRFQKGPIR